MMNSARHLLPLSIAILVTAAAASVVQTQFNLAALGALGVAIGAATRAVSTLEDLARFGPVMVAISAAALFPAMLGGAVATRNMGRVPRCALLALAGGAGLWLVFGLLGTVTPMPALVEATATPGGLLAVCACGAFGGLVYALLAPPDGGASGAIGRGGLRMLVPAGLLILLPAALFLVMKPRPSGAVQRADPSRYVVQTVATGLHRPWSLAFLPDGRVLIAERGGRLLALRADGAISAIAPGALQPLLRDGGELMALATDPAFARNGLLYLSMGYGSAGANGTRLVKARLASDRLGDVRVLFESTRKASPANNGGALAFLPDGTLVMSVGDGQRREQAQNRSNHLGKLIRVDRDGHAPPDNPLIAQPDAAPEVYSLGHRNPQGLAVDPATGALLLTDHGPRGGDEINLIEAGKNYGWPVATGGIDYSFARVTPFLEHDGFVKPLLDWTPSIAPGGLAVYGGAMFSHWRGDLLVPALKGRALRRVRREQGRIVGEEMLLAELGERLRDVKVAPDGSIYVLTDAVDAKLLRLVRPGHRTPAL